MQIHLLLVCVYVASFMCMYHDNDCVAAARAERQRQIKEGRKRQLESF